jgi:hypothetical protein
MNCQKTLIVSLEGKSISLRRIAKKMLISTKLLTFSGKIRSKRCKRRDKKSLKSS